jgi:endonuclease YncB( thermonuclease family)
MRPLSSATITGTASVIDGDTIEIHGTRIRLFGIDAPMDAIAARCFTRSRSVAGIQLGARSAIQAPIYLKLMKLA